MSVDQYDIDRAIEEEARRRRHSDHEIWNFIQSLANRVRDLELEVASLTSNTGDAA